MSDSAEAIKSGWKPAIIWIIVVVCAWFGGRAWEKRATQPQIVLPGFAEDIFGEWETADIVDLLENPERHGVLGEAPGLAAAAYALGQRGKEAAIAVPSLERILKDEDAPDFLRAWCAMAVWRIQEGFNPQPPGELPETEPALRE